jgi:hypothetical protein
VPNQQDPSYWTIPRLQEMQRFLELNTFSQATSDPKVRVIACEGSLAEMVYEHYYKNRSDVTVSMVARALTILSKLGILDQGKPGRKKPGFKRYLYPNVTFTQPTLEKVMRSLW